MNRRVRVRFAPSPTGPLHIGGVRTALYNYLLQNKMAAICFCVSRIPIRHVCAGAEEYIVEALNWLGITIDEGVGVKQPGKHAPYRQSERKVIYGNMWINCLMLVWLISLFDPHRFGS